MPERYKEEILKAAAADIVYTDLFSGVHGNYLKHSVVAAGFDPLNLPKSDPEQDEFRHRRRRGEEGLARHLERGAGRGPDRQA